jgi:tetratricopeptide (TPR) repeat protein
MGKHDWYRTTTWNPDIENAFLAKLARARDKTEYLCIQAGFLTATHPEVALRLIEQYFTLVVDHFHDATAHVVHADAQKALGNFEAARESYEAALAREIVFPNYGVAAYLYLPSLIALQNMATHYDRAIEVLALHKNRPVWPVEKHYWHGAMAILLQDMGHKSNALDHAKLSIEAAGISHDSIAGKSGFGTLDCAPTAFSARLAGMAKTLR